MVIDQELIIPESPPTVSWTVRVHTPAGALSSYLQSACAGNCCGRNVPTVAFMFVAASSSIVTLKLSPEPPRADQRPTTVPSGPDIDTVRSESHVWVRLIVTLTSRTV